MSKEFVERSRDAEELEQMLKKLPAAVKVRVNDIITGALLMQDAEDEKAS